MKNNTYFFWFVLFSGISFLDVLPRVMQEGANTSAFVGGKRLIKRNMTNVLGFLLGAMPMDLRLSQEQIDRLEKLRNSALSAPNAEEVVNLLRRADIGNQEALSVVLKYFEDGKNYRFQ